MIKPPATHRNLSLGEWSVGLENANRLDIQADEWLSRDPDELASGNHGIEDQEILDPGVRRPGLSTVQR